jgi:DNA-binding NtrC family response regulator
LRNVLERARLFADDGVVRLSHLPAEFAGALPMPVQVADQTTRPSPPESSGRADPTSDWEQIAKGFVGNRKELAARLGWSERSLYRRMKAAGL